MRTLLSLLTLAGWLLGARVAASLWPIDVVVALAAGIVVGLLGMLVTGTLAFLLGPHSAAAKRFGEP